MNYFLTFSGPYEIKWPCSLDCKLITNIEKINLKLKLLLSSTSFDSNVFYTKMEVGLPYHSSQFQGLCSTKSSNKMLQDLPYIYIYENPKLLFPFLVSCYIIFPLMNALVYVNKTREFIRENIK